MAARSRSAGYVPRKLLGIEDDTWNRRCHLWRNKKDDSLYSRFVIAPAPSKNPMQVCILADEVILRIVHLVPPGKNTVCKVPTSHRCSYTDFLEGDNSSSDIDIRAQIHRCFGPNEICYIDGLLRGQIDYIARLPRKIMLKILLQLDISDVGHMTRVNKYYQELATSNEVWIALFKRYITKNITHEMKIMGEHCGWKNCFKLHQNKHKQSKKKQVVIVTSSGDINPGQPRRRMTIRGGPSTTTI